VTKASLGDMRERRDRGRGLGLDEPRIRSTSRERARNHTATLIDSFIAGAVSGGVASFVTTPFDVGKTRRQVYLHSGDSKAAAEAARSAASGVLRPEDRSMPRFLWHIFKEEGVAGLFKGVVPRIAKVAPACAIMISSYEMGKKMARDGNREELKG
jgi:solute carrier family 25 protein 39/40